MSENQINSSTDDSNVVDKISKKYFSEIEQYVPHLQQTLFDFQNEYYKTWKNTITANLTLYKEFTANSAFDFTFPESDQKIIENVNDEIVKYRAMCHKITIKSINAGKENAKTWNDNAKTFDEMNKKILHFWLSVFTPK
jgi:hypothetical protein